MKLNNLSAGQKVLLLVLYGLIVLMIVFSFMASRNFGEEAYDKCVQDKCEERGEYICKKYRELYNCCRGTGGDFRQINSGYECEFFK